MKFFHILIVALAVTAILAPTAAARPIDGPVHHVEGHANPMRASVAELAAKEREAKQRLLPGPPAMPMNPQPITPPKAVPPKAAESSSADDGVDWATIGIGVGLTFVALGVITGVTHRIRVRQRRPRVA